LVTKITRGGAPVPDRALHNEVLERLRSEFGAAAYDTAFRRGSTMPYDELVAFAIGRVETRRARRTTDSD
jgi:hypothetical protein